MQNLKIEIAGDVGIIFQQVVLPRRFRTTVHSVPAAMNATDCSLFTKECLKTYTSNWNLIHYKYSAYSGNYLELPK
jgi:hypothetical protein